MATEIFFSYAHEDVALMEAVRQQLVVYERTGKIIKWHDRKIPPGAEWEGEIHRKLRSADIILLFVSPAFIESRYCYDVEVGAALERHQRGDARVIPIILRACAWDQAPFASLQALPEDATPLTQWPDLDQVCLDVARAIIAVADGGAPAPSTRPAPGPAHGGRGVERRKMKGDRIARIIVPFKPPTGVNIPDGYQPRLARIAAGITRESAAKDPNGGYWYPAQVKGPEDSLEVFVAKVEARGSIADRGFEADREGAQVWFEYRGEMSPTEMIELAEQLELRVVHCGVTLLVNPTDD